MNKNTLTVSQRDLWQLVDAAFDIMHPEIHRHHQQVSYLAYQMARALDLPKAHQLLITLLFIPKRNAADAVLRAGPEYFPHK